MRDQRATPGTSDSTGTATRILPSARSDAVTTRHVSLVVACLSISAYLYLLLLVMLVRHLRCSAKTSTTDTSGSVTPHAKYAEYALPRQCAHANHAGHAGQEIYMIFDV